MIIIITASKIADISDIEELLKTAKGEVQTWQ